MKFLSVCYLVWAISMASWTISVAQTSPSFPPLQTPTYNPTEYPTFPAPTTPPTAIPTVVPTLTPTLLPTIVPTLAPTAFPVASASVGNVVFTGLNSFTVGTGVLAKPPTTYMTVSFWLKTQQSNGPYIVSMGRSTTDINGEFIICLRNDKVYYWEYDDHGMGLKVLSTAVVNSGNYVHVAFVKNDKVGEFFINGVSSGSAESSNSVSIANHDLTLGYDPRDLVSFLTGTLSNFQLFDSALTAEQIGIMFQDKPTEPPTFLPTRTPTAAPSSVTMGSFPTFPIASPVKSPTAASPTQQPVLTSFSIGQPPLTTNKAVYSPTANYYLVMQADGNLVVYASQGLAKYSSFTNGQGFARLEFQSNGNLVIVRVSDGAVIWQANSGGLGASQLVLDDTGVLWLLNSKGEKIRAVDNLRNDVGVFNIGHAPMFTNHAIYSPTRNHFLILRDNGDLIVFASNGGTAKWSTKTSTAGASRLDFEQDGNLVLTRISDNSVTWQSNSGRLGAVQLSLDDTGVLSLLDQNGLKIKSL